MNETDQVIKIIAETLHSITDPCPSILEATQNDLKMWSSKVMTRFRCDSVFHAQVMRAVEAIDYVYEEAMIEATKKWERESCRKEGTWEI